jgi:replicative DNA helicase
MLMPVENPVPANTEAEASLLGGLMLAPQMIDAIADTLKPEHFHEAVHGRIFSAIVKERSLGRSPTPATLRPYFEGDETIAEVGGVAYLAQITGSGATVIGLKDFAAQVLELANRRALIASLGEVQALALDFDASTDEIASNLEAALVEIAERETGEAELSAADCAKRVIDAMDEDRHLGVHSGLPALDAVLGPLRPKSLNIVAGRPGMGKSATALSYGLGAARNGHGVLFVSLEMADDEIGERMLSDLCFDDDRTRVPFNAISSGNCSSEQKRNLWRAQSALQDLPIAIVDTSAARIGKIDRLIRRYARRFAASGQSLDLVIVDYLGLVRPDRDRSRTYEEVSDVSRGLKDAAKKHGVAMMALHQLSRKVEERKDKRPNMADLRDSGQIEQDADSILFLYAPEYYLMQEEPSQTDPRRAEWEAEMHEVAGQIEFIVAKRRRGPAAVGRGAFYRAYQAVRG